MSTQRVTISLPKYLYEDLVQQIPKGEVSQFVSQAVEKELLDQETNPIREFIQLREKLPKMKREEVLKAIKKGRI